MAKPTNHAGAPGSPVNDATSKPMVNRSSFKLHRRRFQTMRFGEITPHFVMEGVETDQLPLQSSHDLRTYTMSNILMSDVKMHKEYFSVPYEAILPHNWEKVYINPNHGDDVLPNVNCAVTWKNITDHFSRIVYTLKNQSAVNPFDLTSLSAVLRIVLCLEMWCSSGSLLRQLGYSFSRFVRVADTSVLPNPDYNVVDYLAELVFTYLAGFDTFTVDFFDENGNSTDTLVCDPTLKTSPSQIVGANYRCCLNDMIERMRENPLFEITSSVGSPSWTSAATFITGLTVLSGSDEEYFNFSRVVAYQLVCSHFFSNDQIDYIYSAELYRQLFNYYLDLIGFSQTFSYNGVSCRYDVFSGRCFQEVLSNLDFVDITDPGFNGSMLYLFALLHFQRSLRFRDYFTGSRSQALAVGDVNVAVNNNLVSIVDTTKKIAWQRFFNQVARIGRRAKDYILGQFPGARVESDIREPQWLARTDHDVRPIENENTGADQYEKMSSVTSVLRSKDSRYIFDFEVGRRVILIGVTYFDVPRAYAYSNDRQVLDADRFDMFVPQLQYIGDQDVKFIELGSPYATAFSYTLRDMQYKQSFDLAAGGFVDNLPGWTFLAPVTTGGYSHISPDFIRSKQYELDKFYIELSGRGLASYFHFIVVTDNVVEAKRPMAYAPSIL